jgi:hypothetical protein
MVKIWGADGSRWSRSEGQDRSRWSRSEVQDGQFKLRQGHDRSDPIQSLWSSSESNPFSLCCGLKGSIDRPFPCLPWSSKVDFRSSRTQSNSSHCSLLFDLFFCCNSLFLLLLPSAFILSILGFVHNNPS